MKPNPLLRLCARFLLLPLLTLPSLAEDPPPTVHILATDPHAAEATRDPASFTVIRTGPIGQPLTIHYRIGGTAANGTDYESLSGSVTIPALCSCAPIHVLPFDDGLVEGPETVVIALQQPAVWPSPYLVCWPSVAVATIEDNDAPTNQPPHIKLTSPPEGAVFTAPADIRLSARAWDPDGRVVAVEFFADNRSLGIVYNRPIRLEPIPLGDLNSLVTLDLNQEELPTLYPDLDLDLENDASLDILPANLFHLLWSNAPPGPHVLTAVAKDNRGATTTSDPVRILVLNPSSQPVVNIFAPDPIAAEPDPTSDRLNTALFKVVRRGGDLSQPLTVYYRVGGTASNGEDYRQIPHRIVIPAEFHVAEILIQPLDDSLVEGTESIVLALEPPICIDLFPPPPDCYRLGSYDRARAILLDNDPPPTNQPPQVRIVRPLDGDIFLAPAQIRIAAEAHDPDGYVAFVEFFEGTNSLGIVRNEPDRLRPDVPVFSLIWSNVPPGHYVLTAEATDNHGETSPSKPVEIKVVDRLPPPVVTIEATDPEASEGGRLNTDPNNVILDLDPARLTVRRTGNTDRPLDVYYRLGGSAIPGEDYLPLPHPLTIPAGAPSADLVIIPIDDRLCEGFETVHVELRPPICIAPFPVPPNCYVVGDPNAARAVIKDNDPCPTNMPPKVALVRPPDGSVFTAPADILLVAEAKDPDGIVHTVEFFAGNHSLGRVTNSYLTQEFFELKWPNAPAGSYVLTAVATDNRGASSRSDPVHISILDDFQLPVVTVEATDPLAAEGYIQIGPGEWVEADANILPGISGPTLLDTATFTLYRRGPTNLPLTVYYEVSGSAENGVDYDKLSGDATIPAGAHAVRVHIVPLEDDLVEGVENVILKLQPVACPRIVPPPPECYLVGEPYAATAYIRDNDFENHPPKVDLVQPLDQQIFPAFADIRLSAIARDLDGWVGHVAFFEGTNQIGEDSIVFIQAPPPGQLQQFSMVWSNVPPGRYVLTAVATDDHGASSRSNPVAITVLDVNAPPIVTLEAIDAFAREGTLNTALFRFRRTGPTNDELVVHFRVRGTAENGTDYKGIDSPVTIAAGRRNAFLVIDPIDDRTREPIETVVLRLTLPDPSPVPPPYVLGIPNAAAAVIVDNDSPQRPPCSILPDGLFHVCWFARDGVDYRILASPNLKDWVQVGMCLGTDGLVHFVDPDAAGHDRRFYLAVPDNTVPFE